MSKEKLTLNDLAQAKNHEVHWSEACKKPHEDTSLFRIQDEELGGCDKRIKFRVNCYHLLSGAEKSGEGIIYHPTLVTEAIVNDFHEAVGNANPNNFRFGATPQCKELIGDAYRTIVTLAAKQLKEDYEAGRSAA